MFTYINRAISTFAVCQSLARLNSLGWCLKVKDIDHVNMPLKRKDTNVLFEEPPLYFSFAIIVVISQTRHQIAFWFMQRLLILWFSTFRSFNTAVICCAFEFSDHFSHDSRFTSFFFAPQARGESVGIASLLLSAG